MHLLAPFGKARIPRLVCVGFDDIVTLATHFQARMSLFGYLATKPDHMVEWSGTSTHPWRIGARQ